MRVGDVLHSGQEDQTVRTRAALEGPRWTWASIPATGTSGDQQGQAPLPRGGPPAGRGARSHLLLQQPLVPLCLIRKRELQRCGHGELGLGDRLDSQANTVQISRHSNEKQFADIAINEWYWISDQDNLRSRK